MIKIVVRESPGKPGKWDAFIGDRQLVKGATSPFCKAGRALVAEGVPRDEFAEMWHTDAKHYALRAKVGWLADHNVVQTDAGVARFAKWVDPAVAFAGR